MRRAAKVDGNQAEIVAALRAVGATVSSTAAVGEGFPDIVVGYRCTNYLIEIKDPKQDPCKQKLTKDQVEWHKEWRGQKVVVKTIGEALAVLGIQY